METHEVEQIKHSSNTEVIRRLLIKYFIDKGFKDSFDRQLCPCLIQDMPYVIPVLSNKVEVQPHAEEIDTTTGKARVGWNLFLLGNHRMYLGETVHNNLSDLARQIKMGMIMSQQNMPSRLQTTPKKIIAFITRVLGNHTNGYVDLMPSTSTPKPPGHVFASKQALMGMPSQYFSRSGYGT